MDPPPSSQYQYQDDSQDESQDEPQIAPPPSSQSHFDKFQNFTPTHDAPFDKEFARLALSQQWIPGSQQYTKQRTIAMREELKTHYFSSQTQNPNNSSTQEEDLTEEDILQGYQDLCIEVGIPPCDTTAECKENLKKKLVNIVDLIDARRTKKKVRVWRDFQAFRKYTLQKEHRISVDEAKKDGGYLSSLLQHLRYPRDQRRFKMKKVKHVRNTAY
ncbi:hypothetical protein CFAM422_003030 [Trichoderma lentiforme]|uniref:Uncharacterized protein n=1 Tax=Trichoderma lentiforme TaxID=1567552 RepID=A0A9P4XKS0_9HYPO|nr:hypothetical protein CFAM422_003030 [Trichoderma lentiforme]